MKFNGLWCLGSLRDEQIIPSGFKHRSSWILALLIVASEKNKHNLVIYHIFFTEYYFTAVKSHKEEFYWHTCDLLVFLNLKLHPVGRIVAISLCWIWAAGLHHQRNVKCPYQQQKESSSFSKEKQNSNCNFPASRLWCASFRESSEDQIKPSE